MTFSGLEAGPEDGELLILLHGLPRNSWEWHHQIPEMAELGYRVVAYDLRGYSDGARPEGVEAYHLDEFIHDTLAIADELGAPGQPFHLMGTSIGSVIAWGLAAQHPERVRTLACINIPHPGALTEAATASASNADEQREKFSYFHDSRQEGNERVMFERMLDKQGVSAEESAPYRRALESDEALRAVYNWYRAIPLWEGDHFDPVPMPTTFIWPPVSANISAATVEANVNWVTGPYRLEVVEGAHQPILQAEPEKLSELLAGHLSEHARIGD